MCLTFNRIPFERTPFASLDAPQTARRVPAWLLAAISSIPPAARNSSSDCFTGRGRPVDVRSTQARDKIAKIKVLATCANS